MYYTYRGALNDRMSLLIENLELFDQDQFVFGKPQMFFKSYENDGCEMTRTKQKFNVSTRVLQLSAAYTDTVYEIDVLPDLMDEFGTVERVSFDYDVEE